MTYRRLTERDLDILVKERTAFQEWQAYASYAMDIYGAAAEQIVVVIGSDYNDEYFYLLVESVAVYAADGRSLDPDFSTDWWRTRLKDEFATTSFTNEQHGNTHEDWLRDIIDERRAELPVLEKGGYASFLVSQPPERTHRTVYVLE